MATEDDLRRIALALPGTQERPGYGGRPSFKVAGKGFAGLWKDGASVALAVDDPLERDALVATEPDKFFTTAHYGPDSARLLVRLAAVDADELAELVAGSWRVFAPDDLVADG